MRPDDTPLHANDAPALQPLTSEEAAAVASSAPTAQALAPAHTLARTPWQSLKRVLGFSEFISGNLSLWAARLAVWAAICMILGVATAAWGASQITGVTGIPGPGFFIFGGLFLLLAPAAFALAFAALLQFLLRRKPPTPKA